MVGLRLGHIASNDSLELPGLQTLKSRIKINESSIKLTVFQRRNLNDGLVQSLNSQIGWFTILRIVPSVMVRIMKPSELH